MTTSKTSANAVASATALAQVRQSLRRVLGENHPRYLAYLRDWFANETSRIDFDVDILPFLKGDALKLHNQFLYILLHECISRNNLSPTTDSPSSCPRPVIRAKRVLEKRQLGKSSVGSRTCRSDIEKQKEKILEIVKRVGPQEPRNNRFPDGFLNRFVASRNKTKTMHPSLIANVTHVPVMLTKHLTRDPKLAKYFAPRLGPDQPYLTCNSSVQGRLLLKAWSKGLNAVDFDVVDLIIKACHRQVKRVLMSLMKRTRERQQGETREENGDTPPDPQLTRGSYVEDLEKKPESEEIGGFIKIIPVEDRDRLIALEAGCANLPKLIKQKSSPSDLFETIHEDSSLVPFSNTRHLMLEKLFLTRTGYSEVSSPGPSPFSPEEGEDDEEDEDLFPVCSY